jgi:hypothetical protein
MHPSARASFDRQVRICSRAWMKPHSVHLPRPPLHHHATAPPLHPRSPQDRSDQIPERHSQARVCAPAWQRLACSTAQPPPTAVAPVAVRPSEQDTMARRCSLGKRTSRTPSRLPTRLCHQRAHLHLLINPDQPCTRLVSLQDSIKPMTTARSSQRTATGRRGSPWCPRNRTFKTLPAYRLLPQINQTVPSFSTTPRRRMLSSKKTLQMPPRTLCRIQTPPKQSSFHRFQDR